jgi:hypothetical protein
VIEDKTVSYLEDNNILGESQGAFRKNRRLEDNVFTLQGICSLQKKEEKEWNRKQCWMQDTSLFYTIILTKPVRFVITEKDTVVDFLNTYLAFLDLWKAFERVWREGLFYLLWQNGIQGKCWRLLWSLYKKVNNRVLFGNYESDWFSQDYGVKQGCVLSQHCFRFS